MGAPSGAPVNPPSTISSTALTYEESSEARKSAALATSSGSPQRPSGIAEETNVANFADSSVEIEARGPRLQIGVFVAPGATTFTRMLRGASSVEPVLVYTKDPRWRARELHEPLEHLLERSLSAIRPSVKAALIDDMLGFPLPIE